MEQTLSDTTAEGHADRNMPAAANSWRPASDSVDREPSASGPPRGGLGKGPGRNGYWGSCSRQQSTIPRTPHQPQYELRSSQRGAAAAREAAPPAPTSIPSLHGGR